MRGGFFACSVSVCRTKKTRWLPSLPDGDTGTHARAPPAATHGPIMDVVCDDLDKNARAANAKYVGVTTSWDDSNRGVTASGLSALGKNIRDARLVSKDGHVVPYVRTDNFKEFLGVVDPARVTVTPGGASFAEFFAKLPAHVAYAGVTVADWNVKEPPVPAKVVMRFQNAFVGIEEGTTRQVAPASFSYQTTDEDDPRNMLIVFTPTGWYVHFDGVGYKSLLQHDKKPGGKALTDRWFEVEATEFAVGKATTTKEGTVDKAVDVDTAPSRQADTRLPAKTASEGVELGVKGSGPRCNRMMVVAIPLKQKPPPPPATRSFSFSCDDEDEGTIVYRSCGLPEDAVGTARAARLGVGETVGETAVRSREVTLDESEPIVITQIDYQTLSLATKGPRVAVSKSDVDAVVADMERQYALCDHSCYLSELPCMLHKFEDEHRERIRQTLAAAHAKKKREAESMAKTEPFKPLANALLAFQ